MGINVRWIATSLLMLLALAVMVVNKLTVCSWVRRKNPAATVSVIGGALGAWACSVSPSPLMKGLWWAPMALDIVGAPYLLILVWTGLAQRVARRSGGDLHSGT